MARSAQLPDDMVFYTQITMEAAEDPEFLDAMRKAHIRGALVGVEAVTADGLEGRLQGLQPRRRRAGRAAAASSAATASTCSVRSSSGCRATAETPSTPRSRSPKRADLTFAQFVLLTPFPGTIDFEKWAAEAGTSDDDGRRRSGHAALADPGGPAAQALHPHPTMTLEEIRARTQGAWDQFYSWANVWKRSQRGEVAASRGWRSC